MTVDDYNQQLMALEQTIQAAQQEMVALKKARSSKERVKDYELRNWEGGMTRLSELFGSKTDLIVVHNMGQSCNYCTLWADGFNGFTKPFNDRAAFVLVSPDTPEEQQQFASSRGWDFRILSAHDTNFIADMGFSTVQDGRTFYMPGYSTFHRNADGSIVRVAYDHFGPGDMYCAPWHMFALLEESDTEWHPKKNYA